MPVYKGSTEIASGKLTKGSTEIQNGYKGTDSFFVNEVELIITFTDSTPTGASMSTSTITLSGLTPGDAIPPQSRTVIRAANYILGTPSVTKTGGTPSNPNITTSLTGSTGFQNGLIEITGTVPNTTTTVNLDVTCSATLKTARTVSWNGCQSGGVYPPCSWLHPGSININAYSWTNDSVDTAAHLNWSNAYWFGSCPNPPTTNDLTWIYSCSVDGSAGLSNGGSGNCGGNTFYWGGANAQSYFNVQGACASYTLTASVSESATHQSASNSSGVIRSYV